MSRWDPDDSFPDDQAYCSQCAQWISGIPGGVYLCYDCARPEPKHEYRSDGDRRDPACLTCGRYRLDAVHSVRKADEPAAVPAVPAGSGNVAGRNGSED